MVGINQRPHGRVRIDQSDVLKERHLHCYKSRDPEVLNWGLWLSKTQPRWGVLERPEYLAVGVSCGCPTGQMTEAFGSQVRRNAR